MTTRRGTSWLLHLVAGATLLGAAATAGPALAAGPRCATHLDVPAETLRVDALPHASAFSIRQATTVEVVVTRRALRDNGIRTRVPGASISVRLAGDGASTYRWAQADRRGVAVIDLQPRTGTRPGPARLLVDAWSDAGEALNCGPRVEEHGSTERATRVG